MNPSLISLLLCVLTNSMAQAGSTNGGSAHSVDLLTAPSSITAATVPSLDSATNSIAVDFGDCVMSKPVSNIAVVFASSLRSASTFPADKQIGIGFLSVTNRNCEIFKLNPEYAYRLLAKGENGELVQPTRLGALCGRRFDDLKRFDRSALDWSGKYYSGGRPFWTVASPGVPSVQKAFPAPEDLFKFDKAGRYILFVEVQCFYRSLPHASTTIYPIRFPPVKLPIVKLDDK